MNIIYGVGIVSLITSLVIFSGVPLLVIISIAAILYLMVILFLKLSIYLLSGFDSDENSEKEIERKKLLWSIIFLVIYFLLWITLLTIMNQKDVKGKRRIFFSIPLLGVLWFSDKYFGTDITNLVNNNGYFAIFYYLLIMFILVKTIIKPFAFIMRKSFRQAKEEYKGALRTNKPNAARNVIINYSTYYFLILVIVHILWIILIYTSPTIEKEYSLSGSNECNKSWLYYGKYPQTTYSSMEDINKYMFDLSKWWPTPLENNTDFTCQPCPTNMTPVIQGDTHTTCRPCNNKEEWYSINEIIDKYSEGKTLSENQRKAIGNDGITIASPFYINETEDNSIKHFYNDHSKNDGDFDNMLNNTGMCLPHPNIGESGLSGIDCYGYEDCMNQTNYFIELSWDKGDVPHHHRVFPGQRFEIRDLITPLSFDIPSYLYNPNAPGTTYSINKAHPKVNKYYNPICDERSEALPETNLGTNKCYLRIPVPGHPIKDNINLPTKDKVIRHGSNNTMSGPPCDSINQIAQDYITNKNSVETIPLDASHINHNNFDDNFLNTKYINTGTSIDGKNISTDWRNIYDTIYNICYDTQGQCFMDHAICKTNNETPLPLVHRFTNNNPSPILTIPQANQIGCENISIPCDPELEADSDCEALTVDENSNIIDKPGKCKYVEWNTNKWELKSNSSCDGIEDKTKCPYTLRCIPTMAFNNNDIISSSLIGQNVTYNSDLFDDINKFERMCNRVPRFPEAIDNPTHFEYSIYESGNKIGKDGETHINKEITPPILNIKDSLQGVDTNTSTYKILTVTPDAGPDPTYTNLKDVKAARFPKI